MLSSGIGDVGYILGSPPPMHAVIESVALPAQPLAACSNEGVEYAGQARSDALAKMVEVSRVASGRTIGAFVQA
jgi:hypothetical protein